MKNRSRLLFTAVLVALAGFTAAAADAPHAAPRRAVKTARPKARRIYQTGSYLPVEVDRNGRPKTPSYSLMQSFSATDISHTGRTDIASFLASTGVAGHR